MSKYFLSSGPFHPERLPSVRNDYRQKVAEWMQSREARRQMEQASIDYFTNLNVPNPGPFNGPDYHRTATRGPRRRRHDASHQ